MERGGIIKHDISKSPKTGDWAYAKPIVDKDKCIGCETCAIYCPDACIEMIKHKEDVKNKADIDYDFCKGCGVCAQVCPVKAILMKK
jgi:2-oxoacid:acceptor oxidoreductase delta subunit (pyruvate/2-ketoisovalerate family)